MFRIDLQVQIHVPDTRAPKVISMVGTMQNLVNEVLQAAVGNHFRNTLQSLEAVRFIETRHEVQASAFEAITAYLAAYDVETRGVYIQDVEFPDELVAGADQARDREPGEGDVRRAGAGGDRPRRDGEGARARPTCRRSSRSRQVGIEIKNNEAQAREAQARGEAAYVELTGRAEATKTEAIGLAEAKATEALGSRAGGGLRGADRRRSARRATALVAVANAVAEGHITVVPEVLVTGGGGGALDGLAATLMRTFGNGSGGANGSGSGPATGEAKQPALVVPTPEDEPAS